ncbi:MAG: ABC transporter permease [Caldilineae bacterium]|nr:MAG: ABC transporter permease [Caldilineae bacterium]
MGRDGTATGQRVAGWLARRIAAGGETVNLAKTWAVLVKETRHILRDRTTFLMLLLIPVFLMIIFSYSLAVNIKEVSVTLLDNDRSALSREFVATLSNNKDLVVSGEVASYAEAERLFDRSRIKALVVIPPRFGERILAGRPVDVQVLVDGTDPTTARFAINHILSRSQMLGYELAWRVLSRQMGATELAVIKEPHDLRVRTWYNPTLNNQKGIVPAMLALVLNLPAIAVLGAIVREKELGTLESIFATPLTRAELLVGKIIPYVVCSLISAVLCAAAAVYIFEAPFRGSLALFLLLSADFFLAAFGMALLIATFVSSQTAGSVLGFLLFLFPGFFLSGIFYPISAFPDLVKMEASFIPSTPFVDIIRGLMIKGQGLDALWSPAMLLLGMGLVMTLVAILLFRKRVG